jgi:hypothetical protein
MASIEELLLGMPQEELLQRSLRTIAPGERVDRPMHRLGSLSMARRFGAGPAFLAGLGREVVSGVKSVGRGEPFFATEGFDPGDMRANAQGLIEAVQDTPETLFGPSGETALNFFKGLGGRLKKLNPKGGS